MPPQFDFPPGRDLWAPRSFAERDRQNRAGNYLTTIALLKPGVTVDVASAELRGVAEQLSREYPATNRNVGVSIVPLRDRLVGQVRPHLILLTGAVAFVLLITCVNVANVLLSRGAARTQELAVRAALGARRTRLFAQLLVENLMLSLLGGRLGVVAAHWGVKTFIALAPGDVPRLEEAGINAMVLAFAITLSCATALLFGVLPARHFSKAKAEASLREGPRDAGHAVANRTRRILVIAEVALALTLLTGASLLMRSFMNLVRVDPGFSTENVVALPVFVWSRYPTDAQRATFFQETLREIEAVPGVTAAGAASTIPFSEVTGDTRTRLTIEGRPTAADARPTIGVNVVTPSYFQAIGIEVVRGRTFVATDLRDTIPVAVINETMERRFWPDENALGKRIRVNDGPDVPREIIGIVRDTRDSGLDATPAATVFLPHQQHSVGEMTYVVRTVGDPASTGELRQGCSVGRQQTAAFSTDYDPSTAGRNLDCPPSIRAGPDGRVRSSRSVLGRSRTVRARQPSRRAAKTGDWAADCSGRYPVRRGADPRWRRNSSRWHRCRPWFSRRGRHDAVIVRNAVWRAAYRSARARWRHAGRTDCGWHRKLFARTKGCRAESNASPANTVALGALLSSPARLLRQPAVAPPAASTRRQSGSNWRNLGSPA